MSILIIYVSVLLVLLSRREVILQELTGTLKENHVPSVSVGTILGGGVLVKILLTGKLTVM